MIWSLLGSGAFGVLALAIVGDRLGRGSFALAAVPLTLATGWAVTQLVGPSGGGPESGAEIAWVPDLGLVLAFRDDAFATLLAALVAGIGVLVCAYSAGYFTATSTGTGRFAATILAFATAMLGLVLADTAWTLFLFWEATSVTSFLLVGHQRLDRTARTAARRALAITAAGGLVLLAGLLLLGDASGEDRLSALGPVDGTTATVAAILVMVAAATKSAQVPFHMWLPGAMAAPTPVSAYLHSATMVKAGVVVIAVLAPAFTGLAAWKGLGLAVGSASMLWGALGALRHHDGKLILAWGTISQLGLLVVLFSLGDPKATFAGVAMLVAHATFKAALFMVVGEVDVRTGTRDVRELSGLWRSMPVAAIVAVVAAASMAGAPPLLGFATKEAAIEASLGLAGAERVIVTAVIALGSTLTVAYTVRFVVGVFGGRALTRTAAPARGWLALPGVVAAAASVAGFLVLGGVSTIVRDAAITIDSGSGAFQLLRWPGLTTAFGVSVAVLAAGGLVGLVAARRTAAAPAPVGADVVDTGLDSIASGASRVAGAVQHGSLPGYMIVIAAAAVVATTPFWANVWTTLRTGAGFDDVVWWDNAAQPVLVALLIATALAATIVSSRLGAALVLGAVGLVVTALFVAHGALDLVLTQLLVETVIVVGFVLGLGRLSSSFPHVGALWMSGRVALSIAAAAAVGVALLAASGVGGLSSTTGSLARQAVDDGGGANIVNVILTDVRALDTLGEIMVLIAVAVGVVALTRARPPQRSTGGANR